MLSQRLCGTALPARHGGFARSIPAAVPNSSSCTVVGYTYAIYMVQIASWRVSDCRGCFFPCPVRVTKAGILTTGIAVSSRELKHAS